MRRLARQVARDYFMAACCIIPILAASVAMWVCAAIMSLATVPLFTFNAVSRVASGRYREDQ